MCDRTDRLVNAMPMASDETKKFVFSYISLIKIGRDRVNKKLKALIEIKLVDGKFERLIKPSVDFVILITVCRVLSGSEVTNSCFLF